MEKKKKELTLVGFLVEEQNEFPRLFAKHRMEWKPLKDTTTFTILKSGWFEISFSNQADFHLIWANRPYHINSTSFGLTALIIEGNVIGKLLKMDPMHNSEHSNMFTRFCINTDVEKIIGKGVIV
ncbi:hypothetical protein V2J09_010765 [Rumex salicifolius]